MTQAESSLSEQENTSCSSNEESSIQKPKDGEKITFDYVDVDSIDEDFICQICLHPFLDPVTHSTCGNTFCSKCVENITVEKCPTCSEVEFKKNCMDSAKTIRNFLDKLKVKCSMCKNIVMRGELKDHQEKYCPLHDAYKQVEEIKLKLEQDYNEKIQMLQLEHEQLMNNARQDLLLKDQELMNQFKLKEEALAKKMEIIQLEKEQYMNTLKSEQESLNLAKQDLELKEQEMNHKINLEEQVLQQEKQEFEKQVLTRQKIENSNKPIHLNIGGTIITVSLGTFIHNEREPDNLFKKMFNGEYPLYQTSSKQFDDPIYFIDCKPIIFEQILEWLKFGCVSSELSVEVKKSLLNSCKMFGLRNIVAQLESRTNSQIETTSPISQFKFLNLVKRIPDSILYLSGLDLTSLVLQSTNLEKSEIVNLNFSGTNLQGASFKGSKLSGCDFSGCDLTCVNFQGCDLKECDFTNTILKKTDFTKTNLTKTLFNNAKIEGAIFTSSKFENSKGMEGIKLIGINFSNSTFNGFKFNGCDLTSANFQGCDLTSVNFQGCDLKECDFTNTILKKTDFTKTNLTNTLFNGAKIEGAIFISSKFENSKGMEGIKLVGINFSNSTFNGFKFNGCDLTSANFQGCDLSNCNFKDGILKTTDFTKTNLTNTLFNGAKIEGAIFTSSKFEKTIGLNKSKLHGMNFSQSTFKECDLTESDLSSSDYSNCNFNDCNFESTNLINTNLSSSIISNSKFNDKCQFEGTKFQCCTFENVVGLTDIKLVGVNLSGCKYVNTKLIVSGIVDSDLSDCNLLLKTENLKQTIVNCNLSGCNLSDLNFSGFKFKNVNFTKTNFNACNFENATFEKCTIQSHFKKNTNLKDCKLIECSWNGSTFEEIDFKFIETSLKNSTPFENCTFKKMDFTLLKDLSQFNGSKFDSCLFDFEKFTNKNLQNVQFEHIDFSKQNLGGFMLKSNYFGLTLSSIINNCDGSISTNLYSHTKSKSIPQLLYRGTRDGFKAQEFHSKCDGKGPTLTIIKSEHNQIFGAFTSKSWQSSDGYYVSDSSAFIFKISNSNNGNYQLEKFNIKQDNQQYAIYVYKDCLPIFGEGRDIYISSDCNLNNNSFSNFGNTYELPNGYTYGTDQAKSYLAGSYYFKVIEIEVFKIDQ